MMVTTKREPSTCTCSIVRPRTARGRRRRRRRRRRAVARRHANNRRDHSPHYLNEGQSKKQFGRILAVLSQRNDWKVALPECLSLSNRQSDSAASGFPICPQPLVTAVSHYRNPVAERGFPNTCGPTT
uniref:Uncharacterized protein n=1 Tax=Trichuris muris TaxID=70415 RepID=A0A5S6Q7P5_TRIMR